MNALLTGLDSLSPDQLHGMRRGLEKESLRSLSDGRLALTPHPQGLGSALTHPLITTDYCESQLELITGVHADVDACLAQLREIHQYTYRCLAQQGQEMLWVSSMPCGLPTDETIPLARYGGSNVGRAKSVYRMGLGLRYGRRMQTISGIHYNWSMPGLDNAAYFGLIRNFRGEIEDRLIASLETVQRCGGYIDFVAVDPQVAVSQATVGIGFETQARQGHDVAPEKRAGV